MFACAEKLGRAAGYENAGTVEFVYDDASGAFYFLEVNTRLQVEHGVTEEVTGIDLVEWMIRQAAGELDLSNFQRSANGASIQVRLYSEDPGKNFQPATGVLTEFVVPRSARVETWVARGSEVSPYYDPIAREDHRAWLGPRGGAARLEETLADTRVGGLETNLDYLRQIIASPAFQAGQVHTRYLETLPYVASTIEVLEGGTQTTVQDFPGRLGHWDVGVPPSGPMDALAFRLANRLVGNPPSAAGLEITLGGPVLRFNADAVIALTGATTNATLEGKPVSFWRAIRVKRGTDAARRHHQRRRHARLRCGAAWHRCARTIWAARARSRWACLAATPAGRLRTGDVLRVNHGALASECRSGL